MSEPVRSKAKRVEPVAPSAQAHNQFSESRRQQTRLEHQAVADANRGSTIRPAFVTALIRALEGIRANQSREEKSQPKPPRGIERVRAIQPEQKMAEAAIRSYEKARRNAENAQPRLED